MKSSDRRTRLEKFFGPDVSLPRAQSGPVQLRLSSEKFEKILCRWRELGESDLPKLRGLAISRAGGSGERHRQLVLDFGLGHPIVLLCVDWDGAAPIASLSSLWPYCSWWEMEMQRFDGVIVKGAAEKGGIAWRHA